jgi:hypothetical protein
VIPMPLFAGVVSVVMPLLQPIAVAPPLAETHRLLPAEAAIAAVVKTRGSVPCRLFSESAMLPPTGLVMPMPPAPVVLMKFGSEIAGPLFTDTVEPVGAMARPRTIALVKSTMPTKLTVADDQRRVDLAAGFVALRTLHRGDALAADFHLAGVYGRLLRERGAEELCGGGGGDE